MDLPNRSRRWFILSTVMIGTFMAALDASIVNVSVPVMMRYFGVDVGDIGWIITAYMIAFAVFMPLTSWIRDHHGGRRLYIGALATFTVGSVLCGAAPSLPLLVLARVLQAVGAGALTPSAMALVADVFPKHERGKAFGYWGLGVILGPALGPTLGGMLTEAFGWRSIFLVNLPVGIAGLTMAYRYLPQSEPHHIRPHALDLKGFVMLTAFLVLFLWSVTSFEHLGPAAHAPVWLWGGMILSLMLFWFFLAIERKALHPVVDLKLFRIGTFSAAAFLTFARSLALFGGVFMLPLLLQGQLHYGETQTGLIMLPGALILGAMMPIAGRWADRIGARTLAVAGVTMAGLSLLYIACFRVEHSLFDISAALVLRGIGIGLLVTPVSAASVNSVPHEKVDMASSISSLLQQVGGALGIAAAATFYQIWLAFRGGASSLGGELGALRATFGSGAAFMMIALIPALKLPRGSTHTEEMAELTPLD